MKIVYSYYVLDIVHKGHLLMMKNSKAIAGEDGKLITGILTDEAAMEKKPKPVLSFEERIDLLLPARLPEEARIVGTLGGRNVPLQRIRHVLSDQRLVKSIDVDGLRRSEPLDTLQPLVGGMVLVGNDPGDASIPGLQNRAATYSTVRTRCVKIRRRLVLLQFDPVLSWNGPAGLSHSR